MLRALWFMIKIAVIVGVVVWLMDRPGQVSMQWAEYTLQMKTGYALVAGLVALFILATLYRLYIFISQLGTRWSYRNQLKSMRRAMQSLTRGFSAMAAGDAKSASYQIDKVKHYWPQAQGLVNLLSAQVAKLEDEPDRARYYYEAMLKDPDAAVMGMRGLIAQAVEEGDRRAALEYAKNARKLYPHSPWVIQSVFQLEVQNGAWADALDSLRIAERRRFILRSQAEHDKVAIYIALADQAEAQGRVGAMLNHLRAALKIDPSFEPAVSRLVNYNISQKRRRESVAVIERAWKVRTHPHYTALWAQLAPKNKPYKAARRLEWFKTLIHLNPNDVEGYLAAATVAGEEKLYLEAREFLLKAETIEPSARLYRLWAAIEASQDHLGEEAHYLQMAEKSAPSKVWYCAETGRIYDKWYVIAEPHGSFNSIHWDIPETGQNNQIAQDIIRLMESPLAIVSS